MQSVKPSGQPPKIWQRIEKKDKNGKMMKFTIQEIPEDRHEDAIQYMCTYFVADEPICQCLNVKNDPLIIHDASTMWRLLLTDGISVAAFVDNPNSGKPIIAGINILTVHNKNQKGVLSEFPFKSEKWRITSEIMSNATKVTYKHYEVDKYLNAIGLSVDHGYRGYGLSKDILKVRDLIGPAYGVSVTATAFTSAFAQKAAASVGFEELLTQNFADLVDKDGKEYYPNINSKEFKVMGKRFF